MAEILQQDTDGDVVTFTINNAGDGNRLSDEVVIDLTRRVNEVSGDARVIIFRTAGDDFCLGRAVMGRGGHGGPPPEALDMKGNFDVVFDAYAAFRDSPAPVVCVVQGGAYGLGCALAALGDITIASDKADFQVPEMQHNIMPTMVLSALIDRLPRKASMYLTYSTDRIDAATAQAFGIVQKIVPHAELDDAVDALIAQMKSEPVVAVHAVKEFASNAYGRDMASAVAFAKNIHAVINSSSKMRE